MDDHYCLTGVEVFRDLSRRELAALDARVPLRSVTAGQVVYTPAQPVTVLFIVKRGRLRLFRRVPDGRTVTTAFAGPGTIFGEMDLLGLHMRSTWAEALEPGELCLMSRNDVRELLMADRRIAVRIVEHLDARVADLEDRLTDLACRSVAERLAHTLHRLARGGQPSSESGQTVKLTHHQLATLVGATRERTTTALGDLAQRGLIQLRRGTIVVRDPARLAAFSESGADDPAHT
ncbi:Crp/Fnr family transcriptional regulator [Amycolatopsis cihanbeyliensis]|uniref:CRP-like cAMP-binding protein n=1 Tax=Amycolatopsis cihanbeyliensis TaxID=1128664 RepID=A0A542DF54_AMYCI|nr:Crp/Fnr family transcriptional regulator [Amycolatopsis cihanbeyliensis]TQJ01719.1 CRP-like cAMP-binding protein [Amycolatopsis cihanbeyliensis]